MEHRPLGRTGVSVSKLCLGTMMFGAWGTRGHAESIRIIHRWLEQVTEAAYNTPPLICASRLMLPCSVKRVAFASRFNRACIMRVRSSQSFGRA